MCSTYFKGSNSLKESEELIFDQLAGLQFARGRGEIICYISCSPATEHESLLSLFRKTRDRICMIFICFLINILGIRGTG
jgi:hypothetical protein